MSSELITGLLTDLTLEEKCALVVGKDVWIVNGCDRLGIPEWTTSDGPVGIRGRGQGSGLVVPGPSALAASWDVGLVQRIGEALGQECIDRNVDMLLGPTTNFHRSPLGGRHFESYSEDPVLTSEIAVAYVRGVQSQGVGACIKHLVGNDQETDRLSLDVEVDERALREVYLRPFEAAVAVGVRGVMAAYNYVNGQHCCAHHSLLVDVLKSEWGFDGLVMSDWAATKGTDEPANNGLDLEMPGPGVFWGNGQLLEAVRSGRVDEAKVDEMVRRVLGFLEWRGRLPGESAHDERPVQRPEHLSLVRDAAAAGTVLVRNEGGALPLDGECSVALIGPAFADTVAKGGGSANLGLARTPSLLEELRGRLGNRIVGEVTGPDRSRFPQPVSPDRLGCSGAVRVDVFDGAEFAGEPIKTSTSPHTLRVWADRDWLAGRSVVSIRETITITPERVGPHRIAGLGIGSVALDLDGERIANSDDQSPRVHIVFTAAVAVVDICEVRPYEVTVETICDLNVIPTAGTDVWMSPLVDDFEQTCVDAERLAAQVDVAVVAVGSTAEWETEGEDRRTLELPARQDELVRRVAAVNSNTVVVLNCGAPVDLPWLDEVSALLLIWYPGQEGDRAVADVLLGDVDPGGRMPTTWAKRVSDTPSHGNYPGNSGDVRYDEGVFVGYRHYDRNDIEPLIPFGHGLSYTEFAWSDLVISGDGAERVARLTVTNTGDRPGSDVVQIYVYPEPRAPDRPDRVLAGFAKVDLDPGEKAAIEIDIEVRSFMQWNSERQAWVTVPGSYSVHAAASSADVRSSLLVDVVPEQ